MSTADDYRVTANPGQKVSLRELKLDTGAFGAAVLGFCWAMLTGVIAVGALLSEDRPLAACGLAIVVAGVAFGCVKAFSAYRRRRMLAYLREQSDRNTANAAYHLGKYNGARAALDETIRHLSSQLQAADAALDAHRVGTFWDEMDDCFRSFAVIPPTLTSLRQEAARYGDCLAGQTHTFPALQPPVRLGELDALAQTHQRIVQRADESAELMEIFERRRTTYAPSFRDLRSVAEKAVDAITAPSSPL